MPYGLPVQQLAWTERLRGSGGREALGVAVSLVAALLVFTRWSINDSLQRDEAIYVYGGQQMTHGVAPYVSIFDPKTPLGTMLSAVGIWIGNVFGALDVHAIRIVYFVFALLAVVAVYLLTSWLWSSPLAGVVAAVVFAAFRGWAIDALTGPNAKMPGIFFAVLSMALVVRRRWLWAGVTGGLAFLVWQPLLIYPVMALVAAGLTSEKGRRLRAAALTAVGAAVPVALTAAYFLLAGAFGDLVEAAFVFPATGIKRGQETVAQRIEHIAWVIDHYYRLSGVLFWVGVILLLAVVVLHLVSRRARMLEAVTHPLVLVVTTTFVVIAAFSATDFQGYPDAYPLLPYAALGFGGATALVLERLTVPGVRRAAFAAAAAFVLLLTSYSVVAFSHHGNARGGLTAQRRDACTLVNVLGPNGTLQSLGDPRPLVLTHRTNPNRFVYLASGVAGWHVDHLTGGLRGWEREIAAADPAAIVNKGWHAPLRLQLQGWLQANYQPGRLGQWYLYLGKGVDRAATSRGVIISPPGDNGRVKVSPSRQMASC